ARQRGGHRRARSQPGELGARHPRQAGDVLVAADVAHQDPAALELAQGGVRPHALRVGRAKLGIERRQGRVGADGDLRGVAGLGAIERGGVRAAVLEEAHDDVTDRDPSQGERDDHDDVADRSRVHGPALRLYTQAKLRAARPRPAIGVARRRRPGHAGRMTLVLNILWFIFGGFISGLAWLFAGLLLAITIVGLPWTMAAW